MFAIPSPAPSIKKISENSFVSAKPRAADLQSVKTSQAGRSEFIPASHHVPGGGSGCRARRAYKRNSSTRLLEEFELHFHKTPLGYFESYFTENDQQHCTFARQDHPGRILSEDSLSSEEDSDDDEGFGVCEDQGSATVPSGANERKRKSARLAQSAALIVSGQSERARSNVENLTAADSHGASPHTDDGESITNETVDAEVDVDRPAFVPDDDLFRDRWYADPWNRAPGQTRTKEIQNELNLYAKLRERGFVGRRAALISGMFHKRKGYRFPYKERLSMKKPGQKHSEYLAALKQRKTDEKCLENQVKEYDEDEAKAIAECETALSLFDLVYGSNWPEKAEQASLTPPQTPAGEGEGESGYENEPTLKRRKARGHTSIPEAPETEKALDGAVSHVDPSQTASAKEIEERNSQFRAYKAEVMYETRKRREEDDVKAFLQDTESASFSNGYREVWKETA